MYKPFGHQYEFGDGETKYWVLELEQTAEYHPHKEFEEQEELEEETQENDDIEFGRGDSDLIEFLFKEQNQKLYRDEYLNKLRAETMKYIAEDPEMRETALYGMGMRCGLPGEEGNVIYLHSIFQEERHKILEMTGVRCDGSLVEEEGLTEAIERAKQLPLDKEIVRKKAYFMQVQGREKAVDCIIRLMKGEITETNDELKYLRSIHTETRQLFALRENLILREGLLFYVVNPHKNRQLKVLLYLCTILLRVRPHPDSLISEPNGSVYLF